MNIVVLAGGSSTERDVSLSTGSKVCAALIKLGHKAILLDVCEDYNEINLNSKDIFEQASNVDIKSISELPVGENLLNDLKNRDEYFGKNVIDICKLSDIVFIALHGENGENGKIQACFDLYKIKYTGGDYLSCALSMDKILTRKLLISSGIKMPDGYVISVNDSDNSKNHSKIGYPCVVKVSNGGSSIGVFIVKDDDEFKNAVNNGFKLDNRLIVETYIKAREFSVGVLGNMPLPVIEIAPKMGFYDYKNKYQKGMTIETCPAIISSTATEKMQKIACEVSKILNLNVYCRSDFLMDYKEEIYCLESNSLPGMTPLSLVPQEAATIGISYEELCEKIIYLSMKKYQ